MEAGAGGRGGSVMEGEDFVRMIVPYKINMTYMMEHVDFMLYCH